MFASVHSGAGLPTSAIGSPRGPGSWDARPIPFRADGVWDAGSAAWDGRASGPAGSGSIGPTRNRISWIGVPAIDCRRAASRLAFWNDASSSSRVGWATVTLRIPRRRPSTLV